MSERTNSTDEPTGWTFLSNHAHVLLCLARDPDARMRDVAAQVGITERAAMRIVAHLERIGAVSRVKHGRRNHYEINESVPLRHPLVSHKTVGALIAAFLLATD